MLDWANNYIGKAYDDSCKSEPQCCTEANLLVSCFTMCLLEIVLTGIGRHSCSWLRSAQVQVLLSE